MPDLIQGGVDPQLSNVPEGQGSEQQQPSNENGQAPVVQPNEPSNLNGGGNQSDWEARFRGQQAVLDRMQTQLMQTQQMLQQPQQSNQPQTNPFDPQTQYAQWDEWRMNQFGRSVAEQTKQGLLGVIEQASRQQQEIQWQSAHPQIDIQLVKAFAHQNQIGNLDHAYTLMTLPNQIQSVQQQTFNTALNQFQRPQNQAVPLRGAQGASSPETQGSFEKDKEAFAQTNGRVYNTWPAERQKAFDLEWRRREDARSVGQR